MEPFRPHTRILTRRPGRGVTLIELLVVLAIISVLVIVVITSQSTFNKTIILSNTAYDIALTIRTAENYGIGNRPGIDAATNRGYGVHFEGIPTNTFKTFADISPPANSGSCHPIPPGRETSPDVIPGDCVYKAGDGGSGDDGSGETKVFTLGNGMKITRLRQKTGTAWSVVSTLDVTFARPNTKIFIAHSSGSTATYATSATGAEIQVSSPDGSEKRHICIELSGSIRVSTPPCDVAP